MGRDEFFKKRKAERQARKAETRNPKPNSYLIVTEGKETEPNYFEGLANHIITNHGGIIDVQSLPSIEIKGEGNNTVSLVNAAIEINKKAHIPYESIWLVFDKDDYSTFEQAIILAEQNDFKVAWSNPSFEYWLFLHFAYSDSNLHREEWTIKLRNHFQKNIPECETYSKNMKKIFKIVTQHGSLKAAISRGRRIHEDHIKASNSPDNCCPCTKVYALIENFSPYLDDLLL